MRNNTIKTLSDITKNNIRKDYEERKITVVEIMVKYKIAQSLMYTVVREGVSGGGTTMPHRNYVPRNTPSETSRETVSEDRDDFNSFIKDVEKKFAFC